MRKGSVHIWLIRTDAAWPADETPLELSDEERARLERLRSADLKARFANSRGALRHLLGSYLGMPPREIKLGLAQNGKPFVEPAQNAIDLRFNLSHTGDFAALAFARGVEIGVDIQNLQRSSENSRQAIALRCFSAYERAYLADLPGPSRPYHFCSVWAAKEAVVKAEGSGLSRDLSGFSVIDAAGPNAEISVPGSAQRWYLQRFAVDETTAGALAAGAPIDELVCNRP